MKQIPFLLITVSLNLLTASTSCLSDEFSADSIIGITKRVASYHMKSGPIYPNTWDGGAYLTGIMAMQRLTKDPVYLSFAVQWASKFKWLPAVTPLTTVADDICCFQTYCEIYMNDPRPANDSMIANVRANLENLFYVVKPPQPRTLWSWADALYMAPPAVSRYCSAIKSTAFMDSLDRYWWDVSAGLYDTTYHLWYRDGGFKTQKAANGQPVFWSCGVAWVFGGMTRVLQDMPADFPTRAKWTSQFREMAAAVKAEQGFNSLYGGLWTTSMRDHTQWPDPESSASAFFCFGMAWGINNKVLDSAQYIDCVRNAWRDLVANVGADGRLQRCENVNWQPDNINTANSSFEGEGAFMLAGEEMWKMVKGIAVSATAPLPSRNPTLTFPRTLILIPGRALTISLPSNAVGIEVFDCAGRCLCMITATTDHKVTLPATLAGNAVRMVRYLR
jgi:unsaturated rhamnogalacturonyl hydrolase